MAVAWKGERLGVLETRRHYANYFKGFPNFKEYRMRMVTAEEPQVVFDTLDEVLNAYADKVIA
jgi:tRNA-dihydrouridine synthase